MPGSTFHAAVLAAMKAAALKARPGQQIAAMKAAAKQYGYIVSIEGSLAAGIGTSVPVDNLSVAINVPYYFDFVSGRPRVDKQGVQLTSSAGSNNWSVALSRTGLNTDSLTVVSDPALGVLQSALGFPASFSLMENEHKFVFDMDGSLGAGGLKVGREIGGGIEFAFANLQVSVWKAADFFSEDVYPTLTTALAQYNTDMSAAERVNEAAYVAAMKAHLYDTNFQANWNDLALIELYKNSPSYLRGDKTQIGGGLPNVLGGASDIGFFVGTRRDGNIFIEINKDHLLNSHAANEAYGEWSYQAFSAQGEALLAPSVLRFEYRTGASGFTERDPTAGIIVRGANGLTGPGSILDGRIQTSTEQEMSDYIQAFHEAYQGNCFAAGSAVLLADGTQKPIETIAPGDIVAAFDPEADDGRGALLPARVTRIFANRSRDLVAIDDLIVTRGHPFLTAAGMFVPAATLASRPAIDAKGHDVIVGIGDMADEEIDVYNFEVERYHTYVVGGLRVHNLSLKLDGADGYVSFLPNGDALGLIFSGNDSFKVVDWRKSQNVARALDFSSTGLSERVWTDLASLSGGTSLEPGLDSFAAAVHGGLPRTSDAQQVYLKYYASDQAKITAIDLAGSYGAIVGGALGSYLFDGGALEQIAGSTVFSTIGENLAELIRNDGKINLGLDLDKSRTIFSDIDEEILSAGVGAVSSYLIGELIHTVGVSGFGGEVLSSAAGTTVSRIASNLALGHNALDGLSATTFANVAGGFIGAKLASAVASFSTIGGQIGSALGSSIGTLIASTAIDVTIGGVVAGLGIAGAAGTLIAGALTAGIGAFVGFLVGGLIGSLFGGTPRSGADVVWNEGAQAFLVANAYSKKGGSKDAAAGIASAVARTFNAVLDATGGHLLDGGLVQTGNYGMMGKDYVYRPVSTTDKDAITAKFKGSSGAERLINYGVYAGLTDADFQIAGGDIYTKRAFYQTLAMARASTTIDSEALLGNLAVAQRYVSYLSDGYAINQMIAADPDSVFSAEWAITFARADELGLTRRNASDWIGGFGTVLDEADARIGNVSFGFTYDRDGTKLSRLMTLGQVTLGDVVEVAGQDVIEGSTLGDVIRLSGDQLLATAGTQNAYLKINGVASTGAAKTIRIAATIDAGEGDDRVEASDRGDNVLGGLGNDTLYGGRLDDWLLGGDGDDLLDAGSATAGTLGGNGNYLDGGAGDDILRGREGSDWLEGGDGVDQLDGGAGDDILAGGAGTGDQLRGGAGADQYIVRRGDGVDRVDDVGVTSSAAGTDAMVARMSAIERWKTAKALGQTPGSDALRPDWLGLSAGVTERAIDGGEDAVVFGQGIDLGDIRLQRSGADLIVAVMETVGGTERDSGTRVTLASWFSDPFKRIEWLKFADGNAIKIGDITSFIVGGAGNDILIGTNGDDFIYGGAGNDAIRALGGNDVALGGTGDDLVSGDADNDVVVGGLGNDQVLGGAGNDSASGDEGSDEVYGGAGNDIVSGGKGDGDWVVGGAGDDRFKYSRGDGRDILFDDYVASGWSNVWVNGTYQAGYGKDAGGNVVASDGTVVAVNHGTVAQPDLEWVGRFDYDALTSTLRRFAVPATGSMVADAGNDTLEFAPGIDIQDIILRRTGNDLTMVVAQDDTEVTDSTTVADSVTIKDWYVAGLTGQIEKIGFYQTGVLDIQDVNNVVKRTLLGGTDGSDAMIAGTAGDDWITGGAGDDIVAGGIGNDILAGNSGADTLRGEVGDDVLYGGTGNDILDGGAGKDILIGGGGYDIASYASATAGVRVQLMLPAANSGDAAGDEFFGIEGLTGGSGADTLGGDAGENEMTGGLGTDLLTGNAGNDVYIWRIGDGFDTIYDAAFTVTGTTPTYDTTINAGDDVLELGAGLSLSDLLFVWGTGTGANDLYVRHAGSTANQIQLQGQRLANSRIETLQLADGLGISLANVLVAASTAQLVGTAGDDLLAGAAGTAVDNLAGGDGNDALTGYAGNDQLFGGNGDDMLEGGVGADRLDGGANAAIGSVTTAGDTARYVTSAAAVTVDLTNAGAQTGGDAAGDVLIGIENLVGSAFADTLTGDAGGNRLAGLDGGDVMRGGGGDDVLMGDGGNDTLYGDDGVDALSGGIGADWLYGGAGDDRLDGGDDADQLYGEAGNDVLSGGATGDFLDGGDGNDTLVGDGGSDTLFGGAGDDLLTGGAGDDTLRGDAGNDRYLFGAATGTDTIVDADGVNMIGFDDTVAREQIWLTRSGSDLRISVIGGATTLTVTGFFTGQSRVRAVQTATHAYYLDNADSLQLVTAMTAAGVATPAAMPESIKALLATYWHAGGKAAPTVATAVRTVATNEDVAVAVSGAFGVVDHDGGALTYRLDPQYQPAIDTVSGFDTATGAFVYTPLANRSGDDTVQVIATDADGQSVSVRVALSVAAVNDAPGPISIVDGTLAIAESSTNSTTTTGSIVGQLASVDPDGDAVSYTLVDDAGGRFQITSGGKVTVKAPALLDYEAASSHAIIVRAVDNLGGATKATFTIAIGNVNEFNALPAAAAFGINENVAVGTAVGMMTATDPDAATAAFGQQRYYFMTGSTVSATSSDGRYAIDVATGAITTKVAIDYEAGNVSTVYKVVARDNAGAAPFNETSSQVTIAVANLNEQNTLPASAAFAIAENVAVGSSVGVVTATDKDGASHVFGQQRYYFLNGTTATSTSADGRYAINATTGAITTAAALSYEGAAPSAIYTVIARDNAGAAGYTQAQTLVTIGITDVNEANALPVTYAPMAVAERVAIGTVVGTIQATDVDGPTTPFGTQRYAFLSGTITSATSADGRYVIDAVTGVVKTAAALDYEAANPSAVYTVIARDNAGGAPYNQVQTSVTIGITDVNEANAIPSAYSWTIAENGAVGANIGRVAATDPDGAATAFGQQRYYFLNGTTTSATSSDGRYTIDATSGAIVATASLNFEAGNPSATYTVVARDNAGAAGYNQAQASVTIGIVDLNEANSLPTTAAMAIAENSVVGTLVGTIVAADLDASTTAFGQQRYYFLNGTTASATSSDGRYTIDALTGTVKTALALNFEATSPSVAYTVIARDNAGIAPYNQATSTVTIGITDVNEVPTAMSWSPAAISVVERDRVAPGTTLDTIVLASFSIADPDTAGSTFATYSYAVNDTRFEFVGNSLRLKQGAVLDYEAGATVSLSVTGTDASATPNTIVRTVSVQVVNADDVLQGGTGNDTLTGQQNRDLISGMAGNDVIDGGAGDDLLDGGTGNDRLLGGLGVDTLYGREDADTLLGGDGNDTLYGGTNAVGTVDTLYGDVGDDVLYGEDGDDVLVGGAGADRLDGGLGSDWADYSLQGDGVAAVAAVTADLTASANNVGLAAGDVYIAIENLRGTGYADTLRGDVGDNILDGGAGNDTLIGEAGNDDIRGGAGADTLNGGDGNDLLSGGDGDDTIRGGAGSDTLFGGAGNDFLYADSGNDMLDGGSGDDFLQGGADNDTYVVTRTSGADTIDNYDAVGTDVDVLGLQDAAGAIEDKDLWIERSGDDMLVSVVGTTSSARIKNWYVTPGVNGANYKIDFIVAGVRQSRMINIEALAVLMATKTKPSTVAQRDALLADLAYKAKWATYWGTNAKPVIAAIASQTINEDSPLVLSIAVSDDITPGAGIAIAGEIVSGGTVIPVANMVWGNPDANGTRTLTLTPTANISGTATVRLRATDAGGVVSDPRDFTVTVNPVADTPIIGGFSAESGTSGGVGIALTVNVTFPDTDGSEVQDIWITGVPAGVTLSAGTYDSASTTWKLTQAQTTGLKVNTPAGWSQDLALTLTARATEGGATRTASATTTMVLNAPPTSLSLTGTIAENAANGTVVGSVTGVDPDGDALTFTLLDAAGGRFALTAAGVLTVANGALLNYEAAAAHTISVRATDRFGAIRDQALSVVVTNVNEAPTIPTGPVSAFFDETGLGANPANAGVVAATYALSDPDGPAPQLQFTANPGNWFTIVGNTVRFAVGFDFEAFRATGTYGIADYNGDGRTDAYVANVGVRTTDGVLTSAATNLAVYITDVNEAPVITAGGGMQVMDETGLGGRPANADAIVATFTMVDPDGTAPTLQLVSNPGNAFYLSGNTLRLAAGVSFDFEALRTAGYAIADRNADGRLDAYFGDVRVRATDNTLNSAETVVQFVVSDVNERPNNLVLEASNVFVETTGSDSHSGLLQARFGLSDPDGPAPSLVILSGNDTGWFKVSGQHIQISDGVNWTADWMRANPGWGGSDTTFAYDTNGNGMPERRIATLTLAARDANGLQSNPFTYNIYIENKNEAPAAPVGGGWKFFDETGLGGNPANGGVTVAAFGLSDPDGTAPTLQLVTNPNGWFYVDGNTVKFAGGKTFDFESLRTAGYGINDWNGDGRLDAHIADVYVRATDGALNSTDTLTQVFVSDVNEAPIAPAGGGWQFLDETGFGARPANGGQIVATFGMADPDGTAPGLQLVNNPGNWFYIDGNTLRLNSLNFNYEDFRNAGYGINDWNGDGRLDAHIADVYVRATDGALNSPDTLTQVFISDVNERPNALVMEANNVFVETGDGGNHAGLLQTRFGLSDPDGPAPQLVIKGGNDNGWFQVNGNHIQVTGANWTADWLRATLGQYGQDAAFNYDTNGNGIPEIRIATLTVAARDAAGAESDPFSYNIMIENRNEQNALAGAFGFGVAENAGIGTGVGTVTASDPDGGAVAFGQQRYYFWDGANISTVSGDGRFAIDAASGVIRTNAGLDYEATPGVRYTVTARDNYGNPGYTQSFTTVDIGLGNVNDSPTYFYQVPDNPVISENMGPPGTYVTAVRAADADNLGISYWLDPNTTYGGMFSVTSDGRILVGAAGIDYENGTLAVGGATGRYADLVLYAGDGGAAAATTVRVNITDITLPVWTPTGNGGEQLNPAFAPEWRSTPAGRYLESVDPASGTGDDLTTSLPISNQQWQNEYVLRHTASGRVIAYYSEVNRYQNTFSRRPETTAHYAAGYVVSGVWGSFSVYSPDETNVNEVYGGEWPIGLDLNGDGLDIVDAFDRDIFFDQDGDGLRDRTSWVGADDALLALDRDGNGSIDTGSEISFIGDVPGAKSDLEGLAAFDSNGDGVLDARDARFGEFLVWQDKDQDGVSRSDELRTLTEAGIVSLSLKGVATGATYTNGDNAVLATAAYTTAAGEQRALSDLVLGYLRAGVALGTPFAPSVTDAIAAPIILDLDQDGETVVPLADSATTFDMVGDGQLRKTAWADAGDAFLVRDRNGNGLVDGIADISFVGDKAGARTDLEGLAGFDTNADGVLDARDDSFVGFGAWIDADGNGRTDAGELLSLAQAGISSIALTGKATGQTAAQRVGGQSVIFNTAAITMADGTTRSLSDVGLAYDATALGLASAATASVTVAVQDYDRKAKKFLIAAVDGRMIVRLRKANGTFDPAADQVGPATLLKFRNKTVGMLAPIILDLDGDGIEVQTAKKSKARFDMDGNGTRDDTGWVGKGDGILVIDRDGDGRITTNAELSFLTEKANAGSNFEGLAVLDANKDGLISAADARFGELKVWVDRNRDGITDAGELQTLTDLGITQIGVRASAAKTDVYAIGSNLMLATATFTRADGRIRSLGEVGLAFSPEAPRPAAGGNPAAKALERAWLEPDSPVDIDAVSSPEPVGVAPTAPRDTVERVDWSNLDHLFASDGVVETAPPAAEMPEAQVLQMVQAMSGFGATSAAALDRLSKTDLAGYDYFASAA